MRFLTTIFLSVMFMALMFGCSGNSLKPVLPPDENNTQATNLSSRALASFADASSSYWSDIIQFEGEYWVAHKNPDGTIQRAFGKGVNLSASPEEIIDSHREVFKIPSSSLVKVEEYTHDGIRYVFFRQAINGVQVKDSRVELRWSRQGTLMLLGADVFPGLSLDSTPMISTTQASDIAYNDSGSQTFAPELVIEKHGEEFYLIWWVDTEKNRYHIDAKTGEIIERETNVVDAHEWTTEVEVYPLSPFDTPVNQPFLFNRNLAEIPETGQVEIFANMDGVSFVDTEESPVNVVTYLDSPFVNSIPCWDVYPEGMIDWWSINGEPQNLLFNNDNSHMGQRMVGYDCTLAHDYIKGIDPTYTGMDFPLDAYADCCCTCNAFAYIEPPFKIEMYSAADGCVATSEVADVIIHEYGHIYVAVQYTLGRPPLEIHEGFADVLANAVTHQPEIGKDITGPGTNFRSSVNSVLYDLNECSGESHCVGNIIAGALWEIRGFLGDAYTDYLWHQAKFAQSQSFEGYVVDFYMIDDNDDNVLNGTPNCAIFKQCYWDNHHIPVPATPDIPTDGVVVDIVPTGFPLEMDRTKSNNNLFYNLEIKNLHTNAISFEAWAMVETPWGLKYGPMLPPSTRLVAPITLYLEPDQEIVINLRHSIPGMLPVGTYKYHVRVGDFVDNVNDVLIDDDWIEFEIY